METAPPLAGSPARWPRYISPTPRRRVSRAAAINGIAILEPPLRTWSRPHLKVTGRRRFKCWQTNVLLVKRRTRCRALQSARRPRQVGQLVRIVLRQVWGFEERPGFCCAREHFRGARVRHPPARRDGFRSKSGRSVTPRGACLRVSAIPRSCEEPRANRGSKDRPVTTSLSYAAPPPWRSCSRSRAEHSSAPPLTMQRGRCRVAWTSPCIPRLFPYPIKTRSTFASEGAPRLIGPLARTEGSFLKGDLTGGRADESVMILSYVCAAVHVGSSWHGVGIRHPSKFALSSLSVSYWRSRGEFTQHERPALQRKGSSTATDVFDASIAQHVRPGVQRLRVDG